MKAVTAVLITLVLMLVVVAYATSQIAAEPPVDGLPAGTESIPANAMEFVLSTGIEQGRMVFVGVGGNIDGMLNPTLEVQPGTHVQITLRNGHGMPHDLAIPDLGVKTSMISAQGVETEISFPVTAAQVGTYAYFCTVAGHRQAGMEGQFIIR